MNNNHVYKNVTLYHKGTNKSARLLIQHYKGYPRVSVFVKDINSTGVSQSVVNFAINKQALYTILDIFKDIISNDKPDNVSVEMHSPVWVDDKQTSDTKKSGIFTMGRKEVDGEYINYVSVENTDGLKLSFKIMPSTYIRLMKDNTLLNNAQVSTLWTKSYMRMLTGILNLSLEFNDTDSTKDTVYSKLMLFNTTDTHINRFLIQDYKGNYRVSVFSKDKNEKTSAKPVINFMVNKQGLYTLAERLLQVVKQDVESNFSIDMYAPVWVDDKRTDDIKKVGKVTIGKKKTDKEFVNYVSIQNTDGLQFNFKIAPSPYVKLFRDGKSIDNTELTNYWGKSYADMLLAILDMQLDSIEGMVNKDNMIKSKVIDTDDISKELSDI